jgi:hypothetical protein
MRRIALLAFVLSFTLSASALAQTWQAESALVPNPSVKCPNAPLMYELTLSRANLSLKTPGGQVHNGTVAADGSVSLQYTSTSGAGTVVVSGNARARQLQMTMPRSLPGCVYALKESAAPSNQDSAQWNVTVQQVGGNVQTCSSGWRGKVRVRGAALTLFDDSRVAFSIGLAADGSADTDTRTSFGVNSSARRQSSGG